MAELVVAHEAALRAVVFFGLLASMALWETRAPRRPRTLPRTSHAAHNLALVLDATLAVRLVAPAGAVGVAVWAEGRGLGVLRLVEVP